MQFAFHSAEVHRMLDHLRVLGDLQSFPVYGYQKGIHGRRIRQVLEQARAYFYQAVCLPSGSDLLLLVTDFGRHG